MNTEIFNLLISILPWAGLTLAAGLFVLWLFLRQGQLRKRREYLAKQRYTLLRINVPRNNEKTPLAAEGMFSSLYGIALKGNALREAGDVQDHISFEIVATGKYISFYVMTPSHLRDFVEGQIYAQYPSVEIHEVPDYVPSLSPKTAVVGTELKLLRDDVYPIKTFVNFEVDPLAGITAVLSRQDLPEDQLWIQILVRPYDLSWRKRGLNYVKAVKSGRTKKGILGAIFGGAARLFMDVVTTALSGPSTDKKETKKDEKSLSTVAEMELKAVELKSSKLPFEVKIRLLSAASDQNSASAKLKGMIGTFHQFTLLNINGFVEGKMITDRDKIVPQYRNRYFEEKKSYVLNTEELASLFHLPNVSVETPNIVWAGTKKGEPPANLPTTENTPKGELTPFAKTNFRHVLMDFGIKDEDRRRHIYVVGKTGMGKSTLLENMAIADIVAGKGLAYVDPHGDSIEKILKAIPDSRINDIVLVDPSDINFPISFNLLENVSEDFQPVIASGLISIFKKIWADSWGPRLEYILRHTLLALLENKDQTLLGVIRMLTDKEFRRQILLNVKDPVVLAFWQNEFAQYNDKFRNEAIAPILNKAGQFLATPTVRNIVGQPRSTIDVREIIDDGKILLVKLSKAIGEDNAALLGAMMITKIQLAAMSRVNMPEAERKDFYLYVDEFQNFATESFITILSEARKYHLSLIMANQYIAQMPEEVRDAVFGNVGTMITFRIGATDAHYLVREFGEIFLDDDFVNLNKYYIYLKLSIDGVPAPAFSAVTLPPLQLPPQDVEKIYRVSREKYSRPRAFVEAKIAEWAQAQLEAMRKKPEEQKPPEPPVPQKNIVTPQSFRKEEKPFRQPEPTLIKPNKTSEASIRTLLEAKPVPFHKPSGKEAPRKIEPGQGVRLGE